VDRTASLLELVPLEGFSEVGPRDELIARRRTRRRMLVGYGYRGRRDVDRLRRSDGGRWSGSHSLTVVTFRTLFDLVSARASNCYSSKQHQHAER
jgi:hypothetical protein